MESKQGQLKERDLHQLKWLLGNVLALIGFWSLFQIRSGSDLLLFVMVAVVGGLLALPHLPGHLPDFFNKAATPILVVIIVLDFLLHGNAILTPMVRMISLLALLRSIQYRRKREDLQLLLLALFMLIVSGVLSVSLLFAFQILLFSPLAMALLFIVNLLEASHERTLTREDWRGFKWLSFIQKIRQSLDVRLVALAGALFGGVVLVSSLIFILIPRFSMDQAIPFLELQGKAKVGFSESIEFGDVNGMSQDNSVAMRVEAPSRDAVPSQPYWRMLILDEYHNGRFRFSPSARSKALRNQSADRYVSAGSISMGSFADISERWVFYLEGDTSRYLPTLGAYQTMRFQKKTQFSAHSLFNLMELAQVGTNVFGYSVEGMVTGERYVVSREEAAQLSKAKPFHLGVNAVRNQVEYPLTTLMLPSAKKEREYLEAEVEQITGGKRLKLSVFTRKAIEHLHQRYQYDTAHQVDYTQGDNLDPLVLWMQEANKGWCEHFSGSFILLARTAGFPARAVAGFAGASWNDYENYLVIRNSNAHAWVEIYDAVTKSWIRIDPTPVQVEEGIATEGDSSGFTVSMESGWTAWVDSMRMVWYRRVVDFDQSDQVELVSGVRDTVVAAWADFKAKLEAYLTAAKEWLLSGWDIRKLIQLFIGLVGIILLIVLFRFALRHFPNLLRGLKGESSRIEAERRKAGRLLLKLKPYLEFENGQLSRAFSPEVRDAYEQMLRIRYGAGDSEVDRQSIFAKAKRAIHQLKRA